jgi:glycosyltransferase involved in cell wall biosynthesis
MSPTGTSRNAPFGRRPGGTFANGDPLCFFHFSGFDPDNPRAFSKHQDRLTLDDLGDGRRIVNDYRRLLLENGYAECKKWPYAYGYFDNGRPIPDMGRAVHHESAEFARQVSDPYSDEGYRAFVLVWNTFVSGPGGRFMGITRLAYRIYNARADVQSAMPDLFNGDLLRFLHWCLSSGRTEHNLDDEYLSPIWEALRVHQAAVRDSPPTAGDSAVNDKIVQLAAKSGRWTPTTTPVLVETLNETLSDEDDRLALSRLARMIHVSRPDLQRQFPDPGGEHAAGFLLWFLTYGVREYQLAEVLVAPLRGQWHSTLRSVENPVGRLWYRLALKASSGSMIVRERLNAFQFELRMARAKRPGTALSAGAAPAPSRGVNFIGYVRSEMGVGESVRCAVRAAQACELPVSVKSVDSAGPYRLEDRSIAGIDGASAHSVNVFHVNADQTETIMQQVGSAFTRGKYNIGYWAWELEEFPGKWNSAFQHFDEIWTPSAFCQTAIARQSPIPVVRIPHAIRVEDLIRIERATLSIGHDEFVFLGILDLLSVSERKNPIGILKAFRMASAEVGNCRLVLKINHASEKPAEMARIREAADGLAVTVLDYTMARNQVNGLLAMADCLVSLHRSEGFGLAIAEAMYLGKPVIATGYSGNMDFTKSTNSFLVDYDLAPVSEGCDPYPAGAMWVEPRLEHAAKQMILAATDSAERTSRARAGQADIREHFSPEAVGRRMLERLEAGAFRRLAPAGSRISESRSLLTAPYLRKVSISSK